LLYISNSHDCRFNAEKKMRSHTYYPSLGGCNLCSGVFKLTSSDELEGDRVVGLEGLVEGRVGELLEGDFACHDSLVKTDGQVLRRTDAQGDINEFLSREDYIHPPCTGRAMLVRGAFLSGGVKVETAWPTSGPPPALTLAGRLRRRFSPQSRWVSTLDVRAPRRAEHVWLACYQKGALGGSSTGRQRGSWRRQSRALAPFTTNFTIPITIINCFLLKLNSQTKQTFMRNNNKQYYGRNVVPFI